MNKDNTKLCISRDYCQRMNNLKRGVFIKKGPQTKFAIYNIHSYLVLIGLILWYVCNNVHRICIGSGFSLTNEKIINI